MTSVKRILRISIDHQLEEREDTIRAFNDKLETGKIIEDRIENPTPSLKRKIDEPDGYEADIDVKKPKSIVKRVKFTQAEDKEEFEEIKNKLQEKEKRADGLLKLRNRWGIKKTWLIRKYSHNPEEIADLLKPFTREILRNGIRGIISDDESNTVNNENSANNESSAVNNESSAANNESSAVNNENSANNNDT